MSIPNIFLQSDFHFELFWIKIVGTKLSGLVPNRTATLPLISIFQKMINIQGVPKRCIHIKNNCKRSVLLEFYCFKCVKIFTNNSVLFTNNSLLFFHSILTTF